MQRYTFFGILIIFCIFAVEMKRAVNIFCSVILLTMILLGTSGVSVEKCSCTGKISLVLPMEDDCCPGEGGCMTLKSMHLSDYVPTAMVSLDMPVQPVLYTVFPLVVPTNDSDCSSCSHYRFDQAPPGGLAQTMDVLRV